MPERTFEPLLTAEEAAKLLRIHPKRFYASHEVAKSRRLGWAASGVSGPLLWTVAGDRATITSRAAARLRRKLLSKRAQQSYQSGCLYAEKRKGGDVWMFRWREVKPDGSRTQPKSASGLSVR